MNEGVSTGVSAALTSVTTELNAVNTSLGGIQTAVYGIAVTMAVIFLGRMLIKKFLKI